MALKGREQGGGQEQSGTTAMARQAGRHGSGFRPRLAMAISHQTQAHIVHESRPHRTAPVQYAPAGQQVVGVHPQVGSSSRQHRHHISMEHVDDGGRASIRNAAGAAGGGGAGGGGACTMRNWHTMGHTRAGSGGQLR